MCRDWFFVLLPNEDMAEERVNGLDRITWCRTSVQTLTERGSEHVLEVCGGWKAYTKTEIMMAFFVNKYELLGHVV